jgi:hypothetical protein
VNFTNANYDSQTLKTISHEAKMELIKHGKPW